MLLSNRKSSVPENGSYCQVTGILDPIEIPLQPLASDNPSPSDDFESDTDGSRSWSPIVTRGCGGSQGRGRRLVKGVDVANRKTQKSMGEWCTYVGVDACPATRVDTSMSAPSVGRTWSDVTLLIITSCPVLSCQSVSTRCIRCVTSTSGDSSHQLKMVKIWLRCKTVPSGYVYHKRREGLVHIVVSGQAPLTVQANSNWEFWDMHSHGIPRTGGWGSCVQGTPNGDVIPCNGITESCCCLFNNILNPLKTVTNNT